MLEHMLPTMSHHSCHIMKQSLLSYNADFIFEILVSAHVLKDLSGIVVA